MATGGEDVPFGQLTGRKVRRYALRAPRRMPKEIHEVESESTQNDTPIVFLKGYAGCVARDAVELVDAADDGGPHAE